MQDNPLVSICIPVYNGEQYIEEAVQNFLNQTYQNIEIIVNDDCSTDNTWNVLQKFRTNNKVKLYKDEVNGGIGICWNNAYIRATGKFIVIANADDIHFPDFISDAINTLNKYKADFVTFKYQILNESESQLLNCSPFQASEEGIDNLPFERLLKYNPYHIIFTLFKKENIDKILYKNKMFVETQVCDAEFMLRYAYHYPKLAYSNKIAGQYRIHPNNNSSKPLAEVKSYYYDVVPIWKSIMINYNRRLYHNLHFVKLLNYIKGIIRKRSKLDMRLLFCMIKNV